METADSLKFFGVTGISGKSLPASVAFGKGNIKVVDSTNGVINRIEIETIFVGRGDLYLYKAGNPLGVVHDRPIVAERTFWLYPKRATRSSLLTDYGIFKEVTFKAASPATN